MRRRDLLKGLLLGSAPAALGLPVSVLAQANYPTRPVEVVVGFPGGGALDAATRVITEALTNQGIDPMVVLNKPGASGTIALGQVAREPADGYALGLATSSNLGIAPFLYPELPYQLKDFTPVGQFAVSQNVIYVNPNSGIRDFESLLAKLKAEPGQHHFVSPGTGTTPHLCFELLKTRYGLDVTHVPFKGSPAALSGVVGGEALLGIDAIGPALAFFQGERLVPLAQTGSERFSGLSAVPTLEELGATGLPVGTYLGFVAPAGLPEPVLQALSAALSEIAKRPDTAESLARAGMTLAYLPPNEFAQTIEAEATAWRDAVEAADAKAY